MELLKESLSSRERVIRALDFKSVDRIPITHGVIPAALMKYRDKLVDIFKRYPSDFGPDVWVIYKREDLKPGYRKGDEYDEWGCLWRSEFDGILGQVIKSPLADWKALKDYKFPNLFPSKDEIKKEREKIKRRKEEYFVVVGAYGPSYFFERLQALRGYTNLMMDFVNKPDELYILFDKLSKYMYEGAELAMELEPDCLAFGDDWGTQTSLIISPQYWREFFKPVYKKAFDIAHQGGAVTFFHSDGEISSIIPDFIEIGLNILNPQFSCMDLRWLAETVRGKLTICSDIDRQYILPFGTPDEVRKYVKDVMNIFHAKEGGFIGRGEVNIDVPLDNLKAMYETFWEEK